MNQAVGGLHVHQRDVGTFDGTGRKHGIVAVDHAELLPLGDVAGGQRTGVDVEQQDVGEGFFSFFGVEGCQIDPGGRKGFVGWGEHRKRSFALQGFHQFSLNQGGNERGVHARASRRGGDVVVGIGRRQHGVDDVDDPVAGHHVGGGDRGTVHHDRVAYREGKAVVADRRCRHAVGHIGGWNRSGDHVGQQNVRELCLAVNGVEGGEVNASVDEGLVGGGEEGEGPVALQRFKQVGLDDGADEGVVSARALRSSWNVVGGLGRHEHLVDDMDDAVAGHDVGGRDRSAVHHDRGSHLKREGVAVDGLRAHAVRDLGCRNRGSDHVSEEDVAQRGHAVGGVKGRQVDAGIDEGLVGGSKDRERAFTLQRGEQVGLNHSGDQRVVVARASRRGRDVTRGVGGHQHPVNHVNEAVAGGHVHCGHGRPVHHHAGPHVEGQRVAADGRCAHAVRDIGGRYSTGQHVILKEDSQRFLPLWRVKVNQVNACISEGLVGWSEHRERPVALKCFKQACLDHRTHQRMVLAGAGRRSWHIVGEVGWCQDFVDDVDHAVAGVDVGGGHGGVVDHHAVPNGERQRLSVEGVGGHAVRKRRGWNVSSDDMVLKNVGQGSHAIGGV